MFNKSGIGKEDGQQWLGERRGRWGGKEEGIVTRLLASCVRQSVEKTASATHPDHWTLGVGGLICNELILRHLSFKLLRIAGGGAPPCYNK